jgi:voltage-gated potassium channel
MWEQVKSGRVTHPFEPAVLVATLAMIPVLIIERDATSPGWQTFAQVANWVIWAVFAAELTFVLVVARRKRAALRGHWLDTAIVIVSVPFYGHLLASLRLVRLVRLMRLARAVVIIGRALQAERRLTSTSIFRVAALSTVFLTVLAGAVQSTIDAGDFKTFWDGVWWAVVTVTTVGYGDVYPTSVAGRVVAIAVMLVGVGFLAVLTAAIASFFVKADRSDETGTITAALARIEADLAELKGQLEAQAAATRSAPVS